jgi:hypothetical protein
VRISDLRVAGPVQESFQLPSGCMQLVKTKRSEGFAGSGGLKRYSISSHRRPWRSETVSSVIEPELPLSGFFHCTDVPGGWLCICRARIVPIKSMSPRVKVTLVSHNVPSGPNICACAGWRANDRANGMGIIRLT